MEKEEYPVWTGDHFLYTPEKPAWYLTVPMEDCPYRSLPEAYPDHGIYQKCRLTPLKIVHYDNERIRLKWRGWDHESNVSNG